MCRTNRSLPPDQGSVDGAFAADLAELAAMPARLAEIAGAIPPAQWQTRPPDGGFSLTEHACHLRDIEIEAYRGRLERILAETVPDLADVDGARLARERDYHRQDLMRANAVFAAVRADMVGRLASLSLEERKRTGHLEGVGEISVGGLVAMMVRHDEEHLGELDRLRRVLD